jgi:NAD+ kinase
VSEPTAQRRRVLLCTHTGRAEAVAAAREMLGRLQDAGLGVTVMAEEAPELLSDGVEIAPDTGVAQGCELVVVLGGDGTILRGAELVRGTQVPLLGVNLGHVGFLAESERDDLAATAARVVARDYEVEERMTLDVMVLVDGTVVAESWALNEASVEKGSGERMLQLVIEIDGRPLSTLGCDGVVLATPTGSTAYAFSAGGPVVWPQVEALLLVPNAAHALFARPLVVAPTSRLAVEVLDGGLASGVMWCDGRRRVELPPGARVEVTRGALPVRLARLAKAPFSDRLVAKFRLPVHGWRGQQPTGS